MNSHDQKTIRQESGFTLVELMLTLALFAILSAIAIPNMSHLINSNAIASQSNHFTTAINLARSEAIKRNQRVLICKRTGTSCDSGANWEDGWIIFVDTDSDNVYDSGEGIRVIDPLRNNYTLRPSISTLNWISFQSDGRAQDNNGSFSGVTFRLCNPDADTSMSRAITMNTVGRARLSQGTASCP